jgi:RND family efflux transporter MFP subunit
MTPDPDKGQLLRQLRIDPAEREEAVGGRRRGWLTGAAAAAVIIAAAVFLAVRGRSIEVQEATAAPASTASAPAAILQATGYVTAEREATVSAQIQGQLTHVYIQEGEHVARGQVLARLDDSAQRAALDQAGAQLAAARAQLRQYEVQRAQARRDLARDRALIGQHLVSQQALETAQTQAATLGAQVLTQERAVAVARAGLQGAQVQEDYTIVRAPFAGVVVDKAAQMGETISPFFGGGGFTQTGIATIVDMSSLEVDVDVNEAYIHRVHPGQQAVAVLDAYPDWKIPAHVIAIVPTADKSKATVKVRVAFDRLDPRILPDMGVRVSFLQAGSGKPGAPAGSLAAGTVWVPDSAVVKRAGRTVVFVIQGERARERPVTPGASEGGLRAVQGIASGTALVRAPPAALRDGARIIVKSDQQD